jgi:class 3 adenylate cyclase/DNA-binding CsgD family transcriptional regulator
VQPHEAFTGVVTLMVTDVVGPTRRWQRSSVARDAALVRYEELIAAAVAAHNGRLVKSSGDSESTLSVFSLASDAVGAALRAQRALIAEEWTPGAQLTVRVAVHSGEVVERQGEFFGPAVNRVGRLRVVASGGSVLVGGATAELAGDHLPDDVRLVELGEHRLLDNLGRPERVFGLVSDGLRAPAVVVPPAWAAVSLDGLGVTRREREVLAALADRLTNAEIAARLYVSPRTVETHVASLLRKLGAKNRRQLARLVQTPEPSARLEVPVLPAGLELAADAGPLVGRVTELDALRELWSRVSADRWSLMALVTGEAGIGKSRLVAELAVDVHASGGSVLLGSCFEDGQMPFQPFVQAIGDDLAASDGPEIHRRVGGDAGALSRLFPSLRDGTSSKAIADVDAERADLLAGLQGYLARAAAAKPMLLVVEDVHWATASTRDTIRHLARRAGRDPLLIVATTRDTAPDASDEVTTLLADLTRLPAVHRLAIGGLDRRAVDEFVAAIDDSHDSIDIAAICAETGGNPLLIRELVAGHRRPKSGRWCTACCWLGRGGSAPPTTRC